MFSKLFGKFSPDNLPKRSPDMGYWIKPVSRPALHAKYPQSNVKFDHPFVADPSKKTIDGKLLLVEVIRIILVHLLMMLRI